MRAKSLDMQVLDILFKRIGYFTQGIKRHVDRQNCKEAIFQMLFKLVSEYKVLYINDIFQIYWLLFGRREKMMCEKLCILATGIFEFCKPQFLQVIHTFDFFGTIIYILEHICM